MTPLQSLSLPSQISTPPLVGVHWYSQPLPHGSLSRSIQPGWQPAGAQWAIATPPSPAPPPPSAGPGMQAPNSCWALKSQTWKQAPQLLGSFISFEGLTSSTIPLQSLSMWSQISTPPFVGTHARSGAVARSGGTTGCAMSGITTNRSAFPGAVPRSALLQSRQSGSGLHPATVSVSVSVTASASVPVSARRRSHLRRPIKTAIPITANDAQSVPASRPPVEHASPPAPAPLIRSCATTLHVGLQASSSAQTMSPGQALACAHGSAMHMLPQHTVPGLQPPVHWLTTHIPMP